ncbi:MAG: hypothetical protein K0S25_2047 [Bacillus sp. (in: firmicutes)]|jgi:hypothetical protein|nr:hypothetical protein [Bacillus sp. (in: firmicutes)]
MKDKVISCLLLFLLLSQITGCTSSSNQIIANKYAEAVLTKNNELEFRLKINNRLLHSDQPYKVKVSIHNHILATALGTNEIIYGEDIVYSGEYLEANESDQQAIYITPITLKLDLHPFEIERMIVDDRAISIEVFNDQQVLGKAFLTNFSTQL